MIDKPEYRGWEYVRSGDYHRNLDPNWSYTPTYLQKVKQVSDFIHSFDKNINILDLACGEGVLVEKFKQEGYRIGGLDLNYESKIVQRGDARCLPYADGSFDVILFLDALEHLAFADQPIALAEINRVLKPGGYLFLSVPNLAHLNSRVRLFFTGRLDRTDIETNHPGERPYEEYTSLLHQEKFLIERQTGITLTVPYLYRRIICRNAAKYRWLHDLFEPLANRMPNIAMLVNFVCRKPKSENEIDIESKQLIIRQSGYLNIFLIFTHLNEIERLTLFELARNIDSNNPLIVEVGSYLGGSTCFLATGVKDRSGLVYAVDTWKNEGMSEGARDTYSEFITNIAPLKDWIVTLRGNSAGIAVGFHEMVDLLFFDGDHSYEGILADIKAWLPKVKPMGTVVFHDIGWAEGVRRAIQELVVPLQVGHPTVMPNMYIARVDTSKLKRLFS